LSEDISATVCYIDTECDEEEFSWFSEVFFEVGKATHSQEFVNCLWRYAHKHPEICEKYNIITLAAIISKKLKAQLEGSWLRKQFEG